MLILSSTFLISITLPIIVKAASIQYTSDVTGDILSMSSQGNTIAVVSLSKKVSLTLFKKIDNGYQKVQIKNASLMGFNYPDTDIWRTELLKNHRPQFNEDGTVLYYVDAQFNFMYSYLTQVTPLNPYLNPKPMPNFNRCTGKTCILIISNTYYAYFNPQSLTLIIQNLNGNAIIGNYSWYLSGGGCEYISNRNAYSIMNIYLNLPMLTFKISYFYNNMTVWNYFIMGNSLGYCDYSTSDLVLDDLTKINKITYETNNGDMDQNYLQYNQRYYWYFNYTKKAQRFTGWVHFQNSMYWTYSYVMNNLFQIRIIKGDNNTSYYNSTSGIWQPFKFTTQLDIIEDGYVKWFDVNNNGSLIAYISNYGQLVVVNKISQNDYLDNRCYTSYLYLKNSQICMDIMTLMWVLLGLSLLFPLFLIILFILYCRQRRKNMNQSNGNNMIGELPSQYAEQPTRNNINQNKMNDQALRKIKDNNELNQKNINQTDIHINI